MKIRITIRNRDTEQEPIWRDYEFNEVDDLRLSFILNDMISTLAENQTLPEDKKDKDSLPF